MGREGELCVFACGGGGVDIAWWGVGLVGARGEGTVGLQGAGVGWVCVLERGVHGVYFVDRLFWTG